jgi:L-alanine-DL-glutamate epimerase-like enolase superfamily enzyme
LKTPIQIDNGYAVLPSGPGLGIELDWDFIENCTVEIL